MPFFASLLLTKVCSSRPRVNFFALAGHALSPSALASPFCNLLLSQIICEIFLYGFGRARAAGLRRVPEFYAVLINLCHVISESESFVNSIFSLLVEFYYN